MTAPGLFAHIQIYRVRVQLSVRFCLIYRHSKVIHRMSIANRANYYTDFPPVVDDSYRRQDRNLHLISVIEVLFYTSSMCYRFFMTDVWDTNFVRAGWGGLTAVATLA